MKYFLLIFIVLMSQLMMAQSLTLKPSQKLFFPKVQPKLTNTQTFKKYLGNNLSFVPNKKKSTPSLLNSFSGLKKDDIWKNRRVSYSFSKDNVYVLPQSFPQNALTFSYKLLTSKQVNQRFQDDLLALENNLVQGFVLVHPFIPKFERPNITQELSQKGVGVSFEKIDFAALTLPEIPKNTIYPNPTTGIFNIDLEKEATEIKVTNLIGKVVLSQKIKSQTYHGIDIGHLPKGTYIASFLQDKKWFSERIILIK